MIAQSITYSSDSFSKQSFIHHFFCEHIVALNLLSLCIVAALVIFQIIQVNAATTKGYEIRELENAVNELTLVHQQLQQDTRSVQSLEHVSYSVKMLGFVDAQMPTYISSSVPVVALAE